MKIWLDDLRTPLPEYWWVQSVNDAKKLIEDCERQNEPIELIDLDYDMGEFELRGGTGLNLLKWLCERKTFYPCNVHSTHFTGQFLMEDYIKENWPGKSK